MSKTKQTADSVKSLYAKGAIVNLGENPRFPVKVKTKRPSIDWVTDGGIPKGRLVLIAGEPSAGKSSLTIQIANEFGEKILYLDTEATLTTDYIKALGCDETKFYHAIPESTETMCNIIREQIPNFDMIVVDSINNSASEEQLSKGAEERTMANRAIVLSSQLPILIGLANQYDTTLVILSQIRDNMNKKNPYSPDTIIPGGNSLHHNSSLTLEVKSSTKIKEKKGKDKKKSKSMELYDRVNGKLVTVKCSKNKVGTPDRSVAIEFVYGLGFTIEADIIASALRLNIIEQSGSWYSFKDTRLGQGIESVTDTLIDNPEVFALISEKVNKEIYEQEN